MSQAIAKKAPTFRQIRHLDLEYGVEITAELPERVQILGIHAMQEADAYQPGKLQRRSVRYVSPQLIYVHDAAKKPVPMTFLLLRGYAEIPRDEGKGYEFIGMTQDRNPSQNCIATVWLVSERKA